MHKYENISNDVKNVKQIMDKILNLTFLGGVILSVYTMSILPDVVDRVTMCPPARTICLALLTWLTEILFSVWTVAYNFVPGGEYTREHTDWLLGFIMLSIGAATLTS